MTEFLMLIGLAVCLSFGAGVGLMLGMHTVCNLLGPIKVSSTTTLHINDQRHL